MMKFFGFYLAFAGKINTDFNFNFCFYWLFLKNQFTEGN